MKPYPAAGPRPFERTAQVCAVLLAFAGCQVSVPEDKQIEPAQGNPPAPAAPVNPPGVPAPPVNPPAPQALQLSGVEALKRYLESTPLNTPAGPYEIALGGVNLEDNFNGMLEALNRYVALDLRGCTGSKISPPTYALNNAMAANKEKIVSIILPDTVKTLEDGLSEFTGVFAKCTSLVSVTLPEVTTLGAYAFHGCKALKTIALPKVSRIGSKAFQAGSKDAVFILGSAAPPTITSDSFTASKIAQVWVPANSAADYKTAEHWTKLKTKITSAF